MSAAAGSAQPWDVAIVGGGHNGLVAAFYLASAGLQHGRSERREIVGGCAVTEEFAPGFRASTGAYVLSMLREPVWRDLRLVERGVESTRRGRRSTSARTARALLLDDDLATTQDQFAQFSAADARALPAFEAELAADRRADHAADRHDPAGPATPVAPRDLARLARLGGHGRAPPLLASPTRPSSSAPPRPSTCASGSAPSRCWRRSAGTRSTTRPPAPRLRGPRTCSCTTTRPSRPAAGSASGASSGAASAVCRRRWPMPLARPVPRCGPRRRSSGSSVEGRPRDRGPARRRRGDPRAPGALQRRPEDDPAADCVDDGLLPGRFAAALARLPLRGDEREDQPRGRPAADGGGARRHRRAALPRRHRRRSTRPIAQMDEAQAEARAGRPAARPPHRALRPDRA